MLLPKGTRLVSWHSEGIPVVTDNFWGQLHMRFWSIPELRLSGQKGETRVDNKDLESNLTWNGECCSCPMSKEQQVQEESERLFQIKFENYLHDSVYIKRWGIIMSIASKSAWLKNKFSSFCIFTVYYVRLECVLFMIQCTLKGEVL